MSATMPVLSLIPGVPDHMPEGRGCLCFTVDVKQGSLINGQYVFLADIGLDPISQKMSTARGLYVNNPTNVGIDIVVSTTGQEIFVDIDTQQNLPIFSPLPCQLIFSAPDTIVGILNVIVTNYEIPTVLGEY